MISDNSWKKHLRNTYAVKSQSHSHELLRYYYFKYFIKISGWPLLGTHTPSRFSASSEEILEVFDQFYSKLLFCFEVSTLRLDDVAYDIICKSRGRSITTLRVDRRTTSVIPLSNFEKLWHGMKSRARNEYRKAKKNAFEVQFINLADYYNEVSCLLSSTQKRKKFSNSLSKKALKSLAIYSDGRPDQCFTIGVFLGKDLINIGIFLGFDQTYYYYQGGTRIEYLSKGASTLSMIEGISRCIDLGGRHFDLNGTGDPGVRKWKESFGGIEVTDYQITRCSNLMNPILDRIF
jgi:hypothetical protein